MSRFRIHGTVKLDVLDRILVVEGVGPWNVESVSQASNIMQPLLDKLSGKTWGALVTLFGEPIYVPEAAAFLTESIRSEKKLGRVATAVIVAESKTPEFAKRHLTQIYQNAGETACFFDNKEAAREWLIDQISQCDKGANQNESSANFDSE